MWNLSTLLLTAVSSNQLLIHSFHLKCFLWIFSFPFFGFKIQLSLVCLFPILLFPCFLSSVFLGPALGNGLRISADTFTNPADVPSSLLSLETEGHRLVLLPDSEVCQWHGGIGIHLHQECFHSREKFLSHETPFQFYV
jgi:hypothetical protein